MTDRALFNDGNRKIDYVLIYSKSIETDHRSILSTYIENIKRNGLQTEEDDGVVFENYICVKIHAPDKVLKEFAEVFKIDLTKDNPHYKRQKTPFKWFANISTNPSVFHPDFHRATETLSGKRPTTYTDSERIYIVYKILSAVQFGSSSADKGFELLVQKKLLVDAYPLHESSDIWTEEGPLSDRQLLARYWASLSCFYCYQPLNLIEKYYGPEVGFYFAWIGFYTQTLIVAASISLVCFIVGLIIYKFDTYYIENEVCNSNQLICPVCPSETWCSFSSIKDQCTMMKIAYVLENPVTILYSIFMTFWGRPEFIEAAQFMRVSSITGNTEYYFTIYERSMTRIVLFLIFLIVFLVYASGVVVVMQYRLNILYYGRRSINKEFRHVLELIESLSSSFLTFLIMNLFDLFKNKLSRMLTIWENPRTQNEFESRYIMKIIIFSFGNIFVPVMYLAYFKGKSFSHPGDTTHLTVSGIIKADVCPLSGCLVVLSMQLLIIMSIKNFWRLFKEIMIPYIRVHLKKKAPVHPTIHVSRWEEDYALVKNTKTFLHAEYIQMALQYGFMTFFVVALPIAPILAFANNILEIRFDAIKLLKKSKRTVPQYSSGIETWNMVMLVITVLGCISNPLLIAFSSNFIPRYIYRTSHKDLTGYVNSTLSEFLVEDLPGKVLGHNTTCYYHGRRYPSFHPQKYQLTHDYWYQFAIKSIGFIVLENVCLLFSLLLNYVIPTIPRKVEIKMEYEEDLLRESRLKNKLVS